ncbi:hypothetical protein NUW58_g6291 [Xylaria curta]|uniref:Uncharacterized protein n=1 Tax=Xylaria curta TaxID=42375 RepID=A0ACC1NV11_9PEZI|nr:hypothetical protein NUW58_g6291 [Xylaria curta]
MMASWRSGQSKKMAKTQAALLMTALKAVRVGGRVLYATCSLSNGENDDVIEKALELVQKEHKKSGIKWDFAVRSGDLAAKGLEDWAEPTKYGWLVLPDHPSSERHALLVECPKLSVYYYSYERYGDKVEAEVKPEASVKVETDVSDASMTDIEEDL